MQLFFFVRDVCTLLVARVLVAAFSANVAAVSSVSPAVFLVRKKANAGAPFLASGLGFSVRGLRLVRCVPFCVISCASWLRSAASSDATLVGGGGGARTDISLIVPWRW